VIREEILPVFVDAAHRDSPTTTPASESSGRQHHRLARGGSRPAAPRARAREIRTSADRYISQRVESLRDELQQRRREETQQELDDLKAYAEAERERIETFIADYERKAEAGTDMDIAIRR